VPRYMTTLLLVLVCREPAGHFPADTQPATPPAGLRIKVGIDTGDVRTSLHPVSCRAQYHGRPLNRAARVMTATKSAQVRPARAWRLLANPH
jgi:class 3 adenylate cyclase